MGDDDDVEEPDRPLENASRRTGPDFDRRNVRPPESDDEEDDEDG